MRVRSAVMLVLYLLAVCAYGQKRDYQVIEKELLSAEGKPKADLLIELANHDIYVDQSLARKRGRQIVKIGQEIDIKRTIGWGYRYIGLSFHFEDRLDSARYYYEKCAPFFSKPKDRGWSYYNIATLFEKAGNFDSSYYYLEKAEPLFEQDSAIVELGSSAMLRGNIMAAQGDWSKAIPYFKNAVGYFQSIPDLSRSGDALLEIGNTYASLEDYDSCLRYLKEAMKLYDDATDPYYKSQAMQYIGYYYSVIDELDSARFYLESALELSIEVNNSFVKGNALSDLAMLDIGQENWNDGRKKLKEAILEYKKSNDLYRIADAEHKLGKLEYSANRFSVAQIHFQNSIDINKRIEAMESLSHNHASLSKLYEDMNDYKNAFSSYKTYVAIEDSLKSIEKNKTLQDLLIQYETEKKDSEIKLLNKEVELDAARKKALWFGISLLAVSAISVIYFIIQRAKKRRLKLEQEKQLEIQKRESTERELEYKQKELTAKVLQLASKNEFLQKLEVEVSDLKSSVDVSVSKASQRISRMIGYDSTDDQEWEQFGKEFSSIHSSFLERLKEQFGKFSKSEMRLISLLKMNLSSKEIANTLRISDDGVKKARYRLRKTMGLDSSVDLQEFFLNY